MTPLQRIHRLSSWGAAAALAAAGVVVALPAQSAPAADLPSGLSARASSSAVTKTKTVTRDTWFGSNGNYTPFHQEKTVTVKADKTRDLRGRQRITISWSGAQPSGARAGNPYGEQGLNQEYPVVVMQCRGIDDPALPVAKQLSPETCWTSSYFQRSQVQASPSTAVWTKDPYADSADLGRLSGMDPFPTADDCPTADTPGYDTALTPFRAANGTVYAACDKDNMPPEAAVGAAFPPAEIAAFTDLDGNGRVKFELRSDVENESLGCNHDTACSIVVIPIMGVSCSLPTTTTPDNADFACKKGGQFPPGSGNFANQGVDLAVSPSLWWTASNWRNRISIPITFGLPPDTCDILDPRAPTGFYGSELLAQASLQWSPAYCLSKKRFKFQHNQMPDAAGFALMETGGGPAAEVSSLHDSGGGDPVAYAPTAVTGFGIGFVIDKPDNAGELEELKLTPRLLAKLLTQSYLGSDLGRGHPGIGNNPLSINLDPEFQKLNPGLSTIDQEAAATVLSLSESSDVIEQLTDYIAHDKAAMDFISGKPDPWGMKVNPSYRNIDVPTAEWPLLDTFIPETGNTCRQANPAVYFQQIAAPVTKLNTIAQALIDAWPNVQTRCDTDVTTTPPTYKLGRVDRQSYGARFMLGVVSLGDAARYGLHTASLQTRSGTFVAPTLASLGKAVALMKQGEPLEPFTLTQAAVKRAGNAYPGTMVVYTAARTQHLDQADADKVAQFIRISTTEGQRPGSGNGELPEGFLPIAKSGITSKLFVAAQAAATVIEAQKVPPTPTPTLTPTPTPTPTSTPPGGSTLPPGSGTTLPTDVPSAAASVPAGATEGPAPITDTAAPVVATSAVTSSTGKWLLPLLLGLGIIGGLVASGTRLALAWRR